MGVILTNIVNGETQVRIAAGGFFVAAQWALTKANPRMKTFKPFLAELKLSELRRDNAVVPRLVELLEHKVYKAIPGTRNSYREDSANTNTLTDRHSHVYAKMGGKGSELYALNINGLGHDGSSGKQIPAAHADFFREKGYRVGPDNILESLNVEELVQGQALIIFLDDEPHTLLG